MNRYLLGIIAIALLGQLGAVHAQGGKKVHVKSTGRVSDFYIGDELVTRYDTGIGAVPGTEMAKPIFWPVNAPGGIPLTRNYPPPEGQAKDHPHQKSAWFCHGDVIPEGLDFKSPIKNVAGVDVWSEAKGHGVITCTNTSKRPDEVIIELGGKGKKGALLWSKNEWHTADHKKIMDEMRWIHLYDLGKNARLIVVNIDLHASVCPITFGDTKEGAFAIRINDVINAAKGKGKIQNAEGKIGEKECWGQISAWCDYSGPIDGKVVGLAIFDDPKNLPACWHVRGYGLMAANPFGRDKHARFPAMKDNNELVRLAKGQHLRLRYGMLLHTGDAVSGEVAENYQRFVKLRDKE